MTSTFLIVDGNSIACRGAFVKPTLTNSFGRETGGTYRFIGMLDKAMKMVRATHVVVAWDVAGDNFRKIIDENYKGNRTKKSDSLYYQFEDIKAILDAIGIKNVGVMGYEADDIIGTYVARSEADKTFILSGDKDVYQLINDNVNVIFPKTGVSDIRIMDKKLFKETFDIEVEQYVEMKALMGDGGDNVKGVENCGQKTAAKWLNQYGSLENLVLNASEIKGKIGENLRAWIPNANKTLELVRIVRTVPVPYDYKELEIDLDWTKAESIFNELEFNSYIKKVHQGGFYNVKKN